MGSLSVHNKWLLYSSTVILVIFLLAVHHISVVECGLQSSVLSNEENETVGKGRDKVSGNSITTSVSNTGGIGAGVGKEPNHIRGYEMSNKPSAYINDGGGHKVSIHELSDLDDEEEDEEEGDSYPDDNSLEEIDPSDEDYIENHENEESSHFGRPVMGKCCDMGEGLNIRGICAKITPNHMKHHEA
jgi:hypothetical protein